MAQSAVARRSWGWLLAVPAVLAVVLFGLFPVAILVQHSLGLGEIGVSEDPGPTLAYYGAMFTSKSVMTSMLNSLLIGCGAVLVTMALSIPLTLHLAKQSREGKESSLADALITLPITLPGIIIGFFAIIMLGRTGLVGQVFAPAQGLAFTFAGLFIAYCYFSIPRVAGPLRGAAETIDPEYAAVASTLGASKARVFFTVTLPLLLPAAIEVGGTAASVALGGYGTVATLSEGLRLLPLDVVDSLHNGFNVATSSAQAVVLALMSVGALLLGRLGARFANRGIA